MLILEFLYWFPRLNGSLTQKKRSQNTAPTPTNEFTPPPFGSGPDVVTTAGTTTTAAPATALAPAPFTTTPPTASGAPAGTSITPATTDTAAATEHKILSGENFSTLAKKYGVTTKAIQDANPTLVPTKLQPNMMVKIPAKPALVAHAVGNAPIGTGTETGTVSADVYKVKSNDTLGSIAKTYHTTVNELKSLNGLKTSMIRVGQPLKLPAKSTPVAAPVTASVPAPITTPAVTSAVPVTQ